MKIEPVTEADKEWVTALYRANPQLVGRADVNKVWWRYWNYNTHGREHWLAARPELGCVHYLRRMDGVNVVYELVVAEEERRRGVGTALMAAVGLPCELKTNAANKVSVAFYERLGFKSFALTTSSDGALLVKYRCDARG